MTAAFEPVAPTKKPPFLGMQGGVYRVYKDCKDFVMVPAASALEAIKSSGCEQIYRVERESMDNNYVLAPGKAAEMLLAKEQPVAAAETPAPAAEAAAPAEAPKA
jgi:hypothetical protein